MNIQWEDSSSHLMLNPAYSEKEKTDFQLILDSSEHLDGHIWLSTSGSFSQKWVGLSKQALLTSAASVNTHLESDSKDHWIHALPDFHVGGVSIWARSYLSKASVFDFKKSHPGKWDARIFFSFLKEKKGSLLALVPTQLFDLVDLGYEAPSSLRAVIVGGDALSTHLYKRAIALKWPILPSYGMTECGSQIATASLKSWETNEYPQLKLLPHLSGSQKNGVLQFSGGSLFTTYAYIENERKKIEFIDPKKNGIFLTEDQGVIQDQCLIFLGRQANTIKIGGEKVDLLRLECYVQELRLELKTVPVTLLVVPHPRLGQVICLGGVCDSIKELEAIIDRYQENVLPFERIRDVYLLPEIPTSPLGKILRNRLNALLETKEVIKSSLNHFIVA